MHIDGDDGVQGIRVTDSKVDVDRLSELYRLLNLGKEEPIFNCGEEADGIFLGLIILLPPKYLPFLVQHQLPEGILKLEQPLHADEDSYTTPTCPGNGAVAKYFAAGCGCGQS